MGEYPIGSLGAERLLHAGIDPGLRMNDKRARGCKPTSSTTPRIPSFFFLLPWGGAALVLKERLPDSDSLAILAWAASGLEAVALSRGSNVGESIGNVLVSIFGALLGAVLGWRVLVS